MAAVQVQGEVLSLRRSGAYWQLSLVAPGIAERAKPGQFVALAVGGRHTAMVLRRAFAIHQTADRGVFGGTVDVVFAVRGKGTEWLSRLHQHEPVDVVGPLGRPFRLPAAPVPAVLVGGGYGSAPLFSLAEALRSRRCAVDFVIGAGSADRLFGVLEAKRMAPLTVTTEDGTAGVAGRVSDVLPDVVERSGAGVVYACGPMPMLRAVAGIAGAYGLPCQVAVEESMACGIGVCMTCVLPILGDDGVTRMVRSCVDGPVFLAEQVRFDDIGTVPADTFGAPEPVGGGW